MLSDDAKSVLTDEEWAASAEIRKRKSDLLLDAIETFEPRSEDGRKAVDRIRLAALLYGSELSNPLRDFAFSVVSSLSV